MARYSLSQVVELIVDVPEAGLARGARGRLVAVFCEPREAYEIEFVDEAGNSTAEIAIVTENFRLAGAVAR